MAKKVSKATQVMQQTISTLREGAQQLFKSTKKTVEKGVRKVRDFFFSGKDSFESYNNDNKGRNLILSNHQANEKAFVAARSTNNSAAMRRSANDGAPTASSRVETPEQSPEQGSYTVKRGDTLPQIARNHGTSVEALLQENNLQNPDGIYPNQQLRIPETPASATPAQELASAPQNELSGQAAVSAPVAAERTSAPAEDSQYVVKPGENLGEISERFGVNWRDLARANKINNPDRIFPGQVLTIPSK
jgi:lysozyme